MCVPLLACALHYAVADPLQTKIMGFYHNSLDGLYRAPDPVHVFRELEDYLCSPFDNIRQEAAGPLAFKGFWDKVSARVDFGDQELPDKLKNTLGAIYDAYGGERPWYLSVDTQSQFEEVCWPLRIQSMPRYLTTKRVGRCS